MINYCILTHTNPGQLKKLVNAIHVPGQSRVVIHLDQKSDLASFGIEVKDVWFTQKRVSAEWGTFSVVDAVLPKTPKPRGLGIEGGAYIR